MKEYVILLATDASWLTSQVNGLIAGGWQCQGGVALTHVRDEDTAEYREQWAQAMVKEEEVDSTPITVRDVQRAPAAKATPHRSAHVPLHVAGRCCHK
jgi:hypothetical protein